MVFVIKDALAVLPTIRPMPIIKISRRVTKQTSALFFAFKIVSLIIGTIRPFKFAMSVHLPFLPISLILTLIRK